MLRTIIIDDEKLAIESLKWEIENFCDNVVVLETFSNPIQAIDAINQMKPDLVFLDIEMPEIDGFQLLKRLDYREFDLIITTAYNQYAIQAFKANAIDYLLKPIDPDELIEAIKKASKRKGTGSEIQNIQTILNKFIDKKTGYPKIPLSLSNKIIFIEPEKIIHCKSEGSYTQVFLKENKKILVSKSLKQLENMLPNDLFIRVHKSYIVNLKEIIEYVKIGGGEIILSSGMEIPVSRTYKKIVLTNLNIN